MGTAVQLHLVLAQAVLTIASKAAWFSEWTVVRGQAELPCLVPRPIDPRDKPLLALWYKESQPTVPIYSYDTRSSSFNDGERWAAEGFFGSRAFFRIMSDPPTLVVEEVQVADEAVYTCRVDYKIRPSSISKVNLTVILPPGPPTIVDARGQPVVGSVGPLEEGSHTRLTCKTSEGSPTPTLTWWRDGERLDQVVSMSVEGVESRINVVASRTLQGATLTCQALNNNITEPSATSLIINVLLRPLSVSIVGNTDTLSAGRPVQLVCRAVGSRPPARIAWWRGAQRITEVTHTVMNNGNVTTGSILFRPTRDDDRRRMRCTAANPEINGSAIEDSIVLNVQYEPVLHLALGPALDPAAIEEGDDVYFECTVNANPPARHVTWLHNDKVLQTNISAGLITSDRSLVLQQVWRGRAGVYACVASNSEGNGVSNDVRLTVMFAPVCSAPARRTYGAARMEIARVVCQVEAFPRQVNFTWRFNGSSEGESLPLHTIRNQDTSSVLNYTVKREQDYGTLLCWAANKVGLQKEPCVIHLIPAGLPDSPRNCSISNQTSDSVVVECMPGFDGGLPQYFIMEAWEDGTLLSNTSSLAPEFVVHGLEAGMGVTLKVRAANQRGQSTSVNLAVDDMKVAEKRMGPPERGVLVPPIVGAVVGGIGAILLLVVAFLVFTYYSNRPHLQHPSGKCDAPSRLTNVCAGDEDSGGDEEHVPSKAANPDVVRGIGHKASCLEESRGMRTLDDVRTGVGTRRCVNAVVTLQGNTASRVTTTLPDPNKLMDIEHSEEMSKESVRSSIWCGGEATSQTGLPGVVVRRRDSGSVSTDRSMPSTTSLHDLSDALYPESHYPLALPRVRHGEEVHGTIRRWPEKAGKNSAPSHPRSVVGFLASGHQESAV